MTIKSLQSIYLGKSMIQTRNLSFFLPLLFLAACTGTTKDDGTSLPPPLYQQPKPIPANPKGGYVVNPVTGDSIRPIINSLGDTLITGVPIPAQGKRINPDSVTRPKVVKVPAISSMERYFTHSNRYMVPENLPTVPVDQSKLTKILVPQVAKGDTTHYLLNSFGQKVLTGVAMPITGKKVPAIHRHPTQALPMAMKDGALANIQYLDLEQGLPASFINSIAADKNGNLWFSTNYTGLSRYDGQSFTHFTEKEGLSSNYVNSITEDRKGNLWFSTGDGVSKYDGQYFTHFTEKEGFSNNRVTSIAEDKNGNLWFGTNGGGVSKYNGHSITHFTEKEGLSSNMVSSIAEDKNGNLWFGTYKGLNKYDGKSFTHFTQKDGIMDNRVRSIGVDKNGYLWLGTFNGINKYDGKSFTHFPDIEGLSHNQIISIVADKKGNIWFAAFDGGISKYDGQSFTNFTEKEGLSSNKVTSIVEDKTGNIWFSTYGSGINKYDEKSFSYFIEKEGLRNNSVWAIKEDKNGNIWFGTDGGGVSKYDGQSITHFTEKEGLSSNIVSSILEDKNGNLWFGTWSGGVSKYDGKSFTNFTRQEGLYGNAVYSIIEDKKGNLWFAGGGVSKYDGKAFTHFTEKEGLSSNIVWAITEDKEGNLWFGTFGGASKYDGKSFTHFTQKEGLSNNKAFSILEDKKGNLWFGTLGGGVSKYDGQSFTHFTEKEGLSNNFVRSIFEDKNGILWFGTEGGGVNKYDPSAARRSDSLRTGSSFTRITQNEGLSNNRVNQILEGKNGNFWFATLGGGVSKMDKGAYQLSRPPLVVQLRQLFINEVLPDYRNQADSSIQDIKFDSVQAFENYPINPKIPSDQNHLGFQFSAIDWSAPTKIKYSFRLLGLDNKWSNPSEKTLADYRNLPDGKFTFQVRAIGESGEWSKSFDYPFTILPPWWKTWWAYTIYALLFLGALRMFSLWRERKLRKEKVQLQQKVEERTVELKQKSEQLEHSLKDLKSTQAQLIQSEKLASLGELTAGIAHEIQNPLNFVNNFSEMSVELIQELIEEESKPLNTQDPILKTELLNDLSANQVKINHHGKRASSIVSGMLEHSKASTGERALTDINKLADEYLRLSYHGIRAKDNTFNSDYKTDFDENLPKIEVIPQDMGRVLLNLINNAFWAVGQRAKGLEHGGQYVPKVSVSTKMANNQVVISVTDNGIGMSEATKAKIFQPFFTTKPTGQGTGLGLSLAYDIVTKGHGGTLEVESTEGEGSIFTIQIPLS